LRHTTTTDTSRVHAFALLAISAAFALHATWLACVADDAFITFRFARNLVRGNGLVWNEGGLPVEGYTNFLWMLLSSAWIALGQDPGLGGQVLGTFAGTFVIVYVYRFARRLFGQKAWGALIPVSLLAVSGPHAAWATSGLETSLFALCAVGSVYHFLSYEKKGARSDLALTCFFLFMAILTRPEGVLLLVGLCVVAPILFSDRIGALARDATLPLGLLLGLFTLYFAWRWNYFGYPLPNTFYAKTGGGMGQLLRGLRHALEFAGLYLLPVLPLVVAGAILRRRSADTARADARNIASRIRENAATWVCAGFCIAYTAYICVVGGDYMSMFRFFVPILPFLYLWVGSVAAPLFDLGRARKLRAAGAFLLCLSFLGTLVHSTPLEGKILPATRTIHGTYRGILFERWAVARFEQIGLFFSKHHRAGEALATGAIGAVSYYSDMRVHGFHGLVDPKIAHSKAPAHMGKGVAGHERSNWNYLLALRPDYLVLGMPTFALYPATEWPSLGEMTKEAAQRVRQDYEVVSEWAGAGSDGPQGFFRFLRRKDGVAEEPYPH